MLTLTFKQPHLSIQSLPTCTVPDFCVITGPNGSGKSHLLQAIKQGQIAVSSEAGPRPIFLFNWTDFHLATSEGVDAALVTRHAGPVIQSFTKSMWPNIDKIVRRDVIDRAMEIIDGILTVPIDKIDLIIADFSADERAAIDAFRNVRKDFFQHLVGGMGNNPDQLKVINFMRAHGDSRILMSTTPGDVQAEYTRYFSFSDDLGMKISRIIWAYNREYQINDHKRLRSKAGEDDTYFTDPQFEDLFGSDPREMFDSLLKEVGIGYRLSRPSVEYDKRYDAYMVDEQMPGTAIQFGTLSSGERILLSLASLLYTVEGGALKPKSPKLLLLDEVDAPLHPSMTRDLVNILNETLVTKNGYAVLLATHSPSTVALAPRDSIYLLGKELRVLAKRTREEAIHSLSGGIIAVTENTRFAFVESPFDQRFYSSIHATAVEHGLVSPVPNIVFLAASNSDGSERGGRATVEDLVAKLRAAGAANIFGFVDKDDGVGGIDGVLYTTGRNIENYIMDPILVCARIIERGLGEAILRRKFSRSEASVVLEFSDEELQAAVDAAISLATPEGAGEGDTVEISYAKGAVVVVPAWYQRANGKELMGGIDNQISKIAGRRIFRSVDKEDIVRLLVSNIYEFIPADLLNKFNKIKSLQ